MADLATLNSWLSEAESARHALMMGSSVAEIWRDGRRITYSRANAKDLASYIDWLKGEIAKAEDEANGTTASRRRSISVVFGG